MVTWWMLAVDAFAMYLGGVTFANAFGDYWYGGKWTWNPFKGWWRK